MIYIIATKIEFYSTQKLNEASSLLVALNMMILYRLQRSNIIQQKFLIKILLMNVLGCRLIDSLSYLKRKIILFHQSNKLIKI